MSTDENATEVYNQLMQVSPFLSDTVLKTTIIREDVLDNNMIYDIMVANPQSGKSDEIMDMLEVKNDPMPGYMLGDIYDGRLILGDKEILEAEIAHWKRERFKTFSKLFRHYYSDTVSFESNTPLINLLENASYLTPHYQLVLLYAANHKYTEASQKLQSVPVDFNLSTKQQSEHQGYTDLVTIFEHCYNNAIDLFNPNDSIVTELFALYLADVGKPSAYARNLLIAAGELDYVDGITITPNLGEKSGRFYDRTRPANENAKSFVNVYPNPASDHLIIEHSFSNSTVGIKIFDNSGRFQKSVVFDSGTEVSDISISDLKSGIYFLQILVNEQFVETKKITILR